MRGNGERGVLVHSQLGVRLWKGSARLLITVCWSILQRGKRREKRRGEFWGQKSARRVKTVFNVLSKRTFIF